MKKLNIYIVYTSYQLISAINLACTKFFSNEYHNEICYFYKGDITFVNSEGFEDGNLKMLTYSIDHRLEKFNQIIKTNSVDRLFFFQENDIFNKYLAYNLKVKGTTLALGPDGSKPYGVFSKNHEYLSMIMDTYRDYKSLKKKGLRLPKLIPSWYYRYGYSNIIDEIWLQYPDLFDLSMNKVRNSVSIKEIPDMSLKALSLVSHLYSKDYHFSFNGNNQVIYFNQPFWSDDLVAKENEVIRDLRMNFPDKDIFIKLHPSTSKNRILELESLGTNVVCISNPMPAELFLMNISNALLFTGWSASLMHNISKGSKYYYLYPIFKEVNDRILNQINIIPFPHVKMINNIKDIREPN